MCICTFAANLIQLGSSEVEVRFGICNFTVISRFAVFVPKISFFQFFCDKQSQIIVSAGRNFVALSQVNLFVFVWISGLSR